MTDKIYKIALDARPLSTSISGVGRLIHETIRSFPTQSRYHFYLYSNRKIHPEHKKLLEKKNVTWITSKTILRFKGGLYFNIEAPFAINRLKPDLFWGSQQVIPPFLDKNIPVVLTYYDFVLYLFPETMRTIAAFQQKLVQKMSIKRADRIICISEQTKKDLGKLFSYPEKKSSVAYPGIDTDRIKKLLKEQKSISVTNLPKRFLLSVSTIEPRKNYPFLLKAYRAYRKKYHKNHLPWIIAGKIGWESDEFKEELANEIRHNEDIILFQSPTDSDLHNLYHSCSLFLFASHYEGFGIPLLEALAHQKKCLVSNIPTFHEIGGKEIEYLDTKKPEIWADKINEMVQSRKKTRIKTENFTWTAASVKIEKIFSELIEKKQKK